MLNFYDFTKYFCIIFFFSYTFSGEIHINNECKDSGGKLHSFQISECDRAPCRFRRNKNYTIIAVVEPSRDSETEEIKCGSTYFGKQITIHEANACEGLIEGKMCPVMAGQNYTFEKTFSIPNYVPIGQYYVTCQLVDDGMVKQACGGQNVYVI